MYDAHQANVESHVAVKDVAEFVSNHTLELITGEAFRTTFGHCDNCDITFLSPPDCIATVAE